MYIDRMFTIFENSVTSYQVTYPVCDSNVW